MLVELSWSRRSSLFATPRHGGSVCLPACLSVCLSACLIPPSPLPSAQRLHPVGDGAPDRVGRILLEEMPPATETSVCAGHPRTKASFAPPASSAPGTALVASQSA